MLGWSGIFASVILLVTVTRLLLPDSAVATSARGFALVGVVIVSPFIAIYIEAEWERSLLRAMKQDRPFTKTVLGRLAVLMLVGRPGISTAVIIVVIAVIGVLLASLAVM